MPTPRDFSDIDPKLDRPSTAGAWRWLKLLGAAVVIVALLAVVMMLIGGGHGPGRHL